MDLDRQPTMFSVGGVLRRSFDVWRRNVVSFTLLTAIVYAPHYLLLGMLAAKGIDPEKSESMAGRTLLALMEMALGFITAGVLTYGVVRHLEGRRAGMRE